MINGKENVSISESFRKARRTFRKRQAIGAAQKKEPAVYPYTAGIAFLVTPIPRYAEEIGTTIGHPGSYSTVIRDLSLPSSQTHTLH
jgi:hypothetical protein